MCGGWGVSVQCNKRKADIKDKVKVGGRCVCVCECIGGRGDGTSLCLSIISSNSPFLNNASGMWYRCAPSVRVACNNWTGLDCTVAAPHAHKHAHAHTHPHTHTFTETPLAETTSTGLTGKKAQLRSKKALSADSERAKATRTTADALFFLQALLEAVPTGCQLWLRICDLQSKHVEKHVSILHFRGKCRRWLTFFSCTLFVIVTYQAYFRRPSSLIFTF